MPTKFQRRLAKDRARVGEVERRRPISFALHIPAEKESVLGGPDVTEAMDILIKSFGITEEIPSKEVGLPEMVQAVKDLSAAKEQRKVKKYVEALKLAIKHGEEIHASVAFDF